MSKIIDSIKAQQQNALNQRSQLKDQLEVVEKQLQGFTYVLQVQDALEREEEELMEAAEKKMAADIEASNTPSEN